LGQLGHFFSHEVVPFYLTQIQTIQRLKEERDNMLQQNQQMQRELVQYIKLLSLRFVPVFDLIILTFGLWLGFL
jgi:hypothetical protein